MYYQKELLILDYPSRLFPESKTDPVLLDEMKKDISDLIKKHNIKFEMVKSPITPTGRYRPDK